MLKEDCIYEKYQTKIFGIISNQNYSHLSQHLIWNENLIMSMVDGIPLIHKIISNKYKSISLLKLFLSCLAHFDCVCLNDKNIQFGKKYINFRESSDTIQQYYFVCDPQYIY